MRIYEKDHSGMTLPAAVAFGIFVMIAGPLALSWLFNSLF